MVLFILLLKSSVKLAYIVDVNYTIHFRYSSFNNNVVSFKL